MRFFTKNFENFFIQTPENNKSDSTTKTMQLNHLESKKSFYGLQLCVLDFRTSLPIKKVTKAGQKVNILCHELFRLFPKLPFVTFQVVTTHRTTFITTFYYQVTINYDKI